MRALVLLVLLTLSQSATIVYRDPAGRFTFTYPSSFGTTSVGTDDGFEDRVAAVRFSSFPARFGGEAALTRGFPLVDVQAAGGLYDQITLDVLPAPLKARVVAVLTRLTPANFCGMIAAPTHIDPNLPALSDLTPAIRQAIAGTDVMRNANPHVVSCRVTNGIA